MVLVYVELISQLNHTGVLLEVDQNPPFHGFWSAWFGWQRLQLTPHKDLAPFATVATSDKSCCSHATHHVLTQ